MNIFLIYIFGVIINICCVVCLFVFDLIIKHFASSFFIVFKHTPALMFNLEKVGLTYVFLKGVRPLDQADSRPTLDTSENQLPIIILIIVLSWIGFFVLFAAAISNLKKWLAKKDFYPPKAKLELMRLHEKELTREEVILSLARVCPGYLTMSQKAEALDPEFTALYENAKSLLTPHLDEIDSITMRFYETGTIRLKGISTHLIDQIDSILLKQNVYGRRLYEKGYKSCMYVVHPWFDGNDIKVLEKIAEVLKIRNS